VILVHDTPRIVADVGRRPAAADGGEKNRRQPGSPGNPNRLSNRTMVRLGGGGDATAVVGRSGRPMLYRGRREKRKKCSR